jgi:glycosyltransferase involved in cell wall biosynthesis
MKENLSNPLVSICIPLYNGGEFLKSAIISCLNQSYKNTEIIIVDDGSTDDSVSIAEEFAKSSNKIKIYKNNTNLGLVGNWKKCIEIASGDWIKLLFQDDSMDESCIEKMMAACTRYNTQFAMCAREYIFEKDANKGTVAYLTNSLILPENIFINKEYFISAETVVLIKSFLLENVLGEPVCTLFHKDLYNEVKGFNKNLRQLVDYEFALKIVLNHPFCFIKEKLIQFRVHNQSASSKNTAGNSQQDFLAYSKILSRDGDLLKMLHLYNTDKAFEPLQSYWGAERIDLFAKYIYLKACKNKGAKRINTILKEILGQHKVLLNYKYNFLKYLWVKNKFTRNIKPYLNKIPL